MASTEETHWILADVSLESTRVASASPSRRPVLAHQKTFTNNQHSTLTDILLQFEKDTGILLRNSRCGLSVPGATQGDSISLARSRWTVSRTGLASLFGRPPAIINEVAAVAWSALDPDTRVSPLGSFPSPDYHKRGCWAAVSMDAGVGLATIVVDQFGNTQVLEGEAGHAGFAPGDRTETELLQVLQRAGKHVSWERVISLDLDDPVWDQMDAQLSREHRANLIAKCIGTFVGDVVVTLGAWNGAIIYGSHAMSVKSGRGQQLFNERFEQKHLRRLMQMTPRWLLQRSDATLTGVATMMGLTFGQA